MNDKNSMPGSHGPTLYCGDAHGRFENIIDAALRTQAGAVVLLGDIEPRRPLEEELAPLIERGTAIHFIHGNHDADSDEMAERIWGGALASRNIHAKVVTLPDGTRVAGLGGVFRRANTDSPVFLTSRLEHAQNTPRQHRWRSGPPRKHLGTIYVEDIDTLSELRADVLVSHEAPGYHPYGFVLLDTLAQMMGVKFSVHGHHHDRLDSSAKWAAQGFKSFGVGLRGVTAITATGDAEIIIGGELDGIQPEQSAEGARK